MAIKDRYLKGPKSESLLPPAESDAEWPDGHPNDKMRHNYVATLEINATPMGHGELATRIAAAFDDEPDIAPNRVIVTGAFSAFEDAQQTAFKKLSRDERELIVEAISAAIGTWESTAFDDALTGSSSIDDREVALWSLKKLEAAEKLYLRVTGQHYPGSKTEEK